MPIIETINVILQSIKDNASSYSEDLGALVCTLEILQGCVTFLDESKYPILSRRFHYLVATRSIPTTLFEKLYSELIEIRDITNRLLQSKRW